MSHGCRIPQAIGIPFTGAVSCVFGLLLFSLPVGAYVVFETDIGGDINHEFPLSGLASLEGTPLGHLPGWITVGDAFAALWAAYAVLFAVAAAGPRAGFLEELGRIITSGRSDPGSSYMVGAAKWLSVLVLASAAIIRLQDGLGVGLEAPQVHNGLVHFFHVSLAPLPEEAAFRALLIGVPLLLLFSAGRTGGAARLLWNPSSAGVAPGRGAAVLVAASGALFGVAHVASGDLWGPGKLAQATAAGVILGWVYLRYGLAASVLVHWATNYFVFAYAGFVSQAVPVPVEEAFAHPIMAALEAVLVAAGCISVALMAAERLARRTRGPGPS